MRTNYGDARVFNANVDVIDPYRAVPGGRVDLLVASPECISFSVARGDKPIREQSRSSAAFIYEWLTHPKVQVDNFILENVSEWQSWGPLDKDMRPIKEHEGEYFDSFIAEIRKIGYDVAYDVLNAADFGDATSRRRIFVMGRSDGEIVRMPQPTHAEDPSKIRSRKLKPWVPARNIIEWSNRGTSIFNRLAGPHSVKSVRRMRAGFEKQSTPLAPGYAEAIRRFEQVAEEYQKASKNVLARFPSKKKSDADARRECKDRLRKAARSETRRLFSTAVGSYTSEELLEVVERARRESQTDGTHGRVETLFVGQHAGSVPRDARTSPAMTITTRGAMSKFDGTLVDATLIKMNASDKSTFDDATRSPDKTMITIVAKDCTGIAVPAGAEEILAAEINLAGEGFIFCVNHGGKSNRVTSFDETHGTITTKKSTAKVQPHLSPPEPFVSEQRGFYGEKTQPYSAKTIDETISGITAHTNHHALISAEIQPDPFMSQMRGFFGEEGARRSAHSVNGPIGALAASGNHHGLVESRLVDGFATANFGERVGQTPRTSSLDEPAWVTTGRGAGNLIVPELVNSLEVSGFPEPNDTQDQAFPLVDPIEVSINSDPKCIVNTDVSEGDNNESAEIDQADMIRPFILIDNRKHEIDVLFRMFTNRELAKFTSFIDDCHEYKFAGGTAAVTRQIGNAVPVNIARALAREQLRFDIDKSLRKRTRSIVSRKLIKDAEAPKVTAQRRHVA